MYKKVNVVMLPTNEKSKLILSFKEKSFNYLTEPKLTLIVEEANYQLSNIQSQHLYIISDEKIKEGDWYIDDCNQIRRSVTSDKEYWSVREDYKKIIATTDKNLVTKYDERFEDVTINKNSLNQKLPQLPQQFIYDYIAEYNKGNVITEVMVEYEDCGTIDSTCGLIPHISTEGDTFYMGTKLKVNLHNTINVKLIKNTWNREEVVKLLHKSHCLKSISFIQNNSLDKWIEENL